VGSTYAGGAGVGAGGAGGAGGAAGGAGVASPAISSFSLCTTASDILITPAASSLTTVIFLLLWFAPMVVERLFRTHYSLPHHLL